MDPIERQAAIDEVARWTGYLDEDMITRIQIGLKRLPSAQPTQSNTSNTLNALDCVSRKAAIDALKGTVTVTGRENANNVRAFVNLVLDRIKRLPSAQPDIIRCKDCKHFEYDHPYIIQGIPVLGHEVCNAWGDGCKTDENGYCFMAERRTDED